jgi:hypothetical protein
MGFPPISAKGLLGRRVAFKREGITIRGGVVMHLLSFGLFVMFF